MARSVAPSWPVSTSISAAHQSGGVPSMITRMDLMITVSFQTYRLKTDRDPGC